MLLETLTRSTREELKSTTAWPHSAAGKDLQHLAGAISPEDAGQMREAIEQVTARLHFGPPRRICNPWELTGCLWTSAKEV
jgi:hypothetical protein